MRIGWEGSICVIGELEEPLKTRVETIHGSFHRISFLRVSGQWHWLVDMGKEGGGLGRIPISCQNQNVLYKR